MKVAVLFQDIEIAEVFADLVSCMGAQPEIIIHEGGLGLSESHKVITEPMYFENLPTHLQEQCLLVGNKNVLERFEVPALSRPLTEEKVNQALDRFLSSHNA